MIESLSQEKIKCPAPYILNMIPKCTYKFNDVLSQIFRYSLEIEKSIFARLPQSPEEIKQINVHSSNCNIYSQYIHIFLYDNESTVVEYNATLHDVVEFREKVTTVLDPVYGLF